MIELSALCVLMDRRRVFAVATIAAPGDLHLGLERFAPDGLVRIMADGEAEVEIAGRPFVLRRSKTDPEIAGAVHDCCSHGRTFRSG